MEIKFKKETIKKILKLYFKKYEDTDCNIIISTEIGYKGYSKVKNCIVLIKQIIEIDILGERMKTTKVLTEEEIENAIETILKDEGLKLKYLTYDKEVNNVWCGKSGEDNYQPVFNGIVVEVEKLEKDKQKTIGGLNNNENILR